MKQESRDFSRGRFKLSSDSGLVKLGQPQPESNLSAELNRGSPLTMSTYMPSSE